jgi:hypothetical protein
VHLADQAVAVADHLQRVDQAPLVALEPRVKGIQGVMLGVFPHTHLAAVVVQVLLEVMLLVALVEMAVRDQ